jgi:carbamoyl-phosphate synthase large subunit
VEQQGIDLIIPGIEPDLYKLWESKDKVRTKIMLNNDLCIRISKNKLETYKYLSGKGIGLIPTLYQTGFRNCADGLGLPFLLKPESSSASKGIEVIHNEKEFDFFSQRVDGKCIYQKIVGTDDSEYTVAVFGDGTGEILDHLILKRKLSGEGATRKATVAEDAAIWEYVKKLSAILKPVGPLNVQVRKEGDHVYLLEINPRISSACSIRTLLGYNEPEMCLKYFLTKEPVVPGKKGKGTIVRFISDYYFQK